MRYLLFSTSLILLTFNFRAQLDVTYKKLPKEILDLVDIDPTPYLYMDAEEERGVFISRDAFKSLEDLAQDEVRLGETSRLVLLPYESHAYAAKDNILHMLWEMDQWLEIHVKNKGK